MAALLDEVLERYPLHPAALVAVREQARRRLLEDPEEDAETAVGAAIAELTRQCRGCGVLFSVRRTVMARCDLCNACGCPSCLKLMRFANGFGLICPACAVQLPRDLGALDALRRAVLWAEREGGPLGQS